MTLFVVLAAVLVVVSLAFLVPPLLRTRAAGAPSERAANLSVYRDQVAELDRDRAAGVLPQEQYAQARGELEQRLLDDVQSASVAPARGGKWSSRGTAVIVAVAVPVLAGLLYWHLGTPQAVVTAARGTVDPANMTVSSFSR